MRSFPSLKCSLYLAVSGSIAAGVVWLPLHPHSFERASFAVSQTGDHFQSRPVVMGKRGVASTPHPLASEAAIEILKEGGNAVDAAVAAAAVVSVVQPFTSGIGGVGYATVYDVESKDVYILDFSGRVPTETRADLFPALQGRVDTVELENQRKNLLGSLTPGVIAGWEELLRRFGSISLRRVLSRAIELAEEGFPVSFLLHKTMVTQRHRLRQWKASERIFLQKGLPYQPGEILRQQDLSATFRQIAQGGSKEFYRDQVAHQLVDFFQRRDGTLSAADLADYKPTWLEPIKGAYRGYTVYGAPPPASDAVFFEALNILSLFSRENWQPGSVDYVHAGLEASKLGRSDRLHYFGDPDFVSPVPIQRLLSLEYARQQKRRIQTEQAFPGDPLPEISDSHTIQLCVIDRWGNAVNLLQTVGMSFGNAAVADQTGIVLNSMLYFSPLDSKNPNAIAPRRRIEMNPLTIMVFDEDEKLFLMLGSPGGKTIIQTVRQMLINVIDFGMNLQQAIDAPRFLIRPDGITAAIEIPLLEINPDLKKELEGLGHRVVLVPPSLGSGQGILVDPISGTRMGGSDFRTESYSLAY
ncbi:gamma-glutamyltransferase [Acidobacteria bacterium AH-259-D05]|nr:gamma-glutamyltransferase [Acidobacteria bacterium AH-259-D05]